jgi:hypothetical protein
MVIDVLLLAFAGLAHQQHSLPSMCVPLASAVISALDELSMILGERQVLEVGLAGAAAAAHVGGARLAHAPAPGQDVDVALRTLDLVARLALDLLAHVDEHIQCHVYSPFADGSFDTRRSDTVRPSSW